MGLTTKEIGSSSFNDMISSVDRRSEYVENRAGANVTLNNFLTPYTLDNKSSILNAPCGYSNGMYASLRPVETFGSELITNGDFATDSDWSKGTGWSISGGTANSDGTINQSLLQTNVFTIGKKYKINFTISNVVGDLHARIWMATGSAKIEVNSDGNYTTYWVADQLSLYITTLSTNTATYSIDNVSVKEVTDADFQFSRGSSATRVNEKGLIEDVQILSGELVQNGDFSQEGAELITNGDFATDSDWTLTSNVAISGGKLNFTNATTNTHFANQVISAPVGSIYKITLEVSNLGSGEFIKIRFPFQDTSINANGTYTIFGEGNTANAFRITPASATATFSIDNVSVKEVGQNWTFVGTASISDGKATINSPSGELAEIYQSSVLTIGKKYKLECTLDKTSGDTQFVNGGTFILDNGSNTIEFIATDTRVYFKRGAGSVISSIDNISVIEITDDTDLPRIDYTNGTGALLLEPQSTNLYTNSEPTSNEGATSGVSYVDYNWSLGFTNATEFTSGDFRYGGNVSASTVNTLSFFIIMDDLSQPVVGANSGAGDFSVVIGGSVMTSGFEVKNFGNNVYRVCVTGTSGTNTGNNGIIKYNSQSSKAFKVVGWQVEQNSYATSYIPTNGSTVTRNADSCNNAGSSDLINSTEGVLYAEISRFANDTLNTTISINQSDNSTNSVSIKFRSTENLIFGLVYSNGNISTLMQYTLSDDTQFNKIAISYAENNFSLWVNGVKVLTDTSGNTPIGLNNLSFNSGVFENFFGNVKSVAVFKEALTDEELAKITSTTQQEVFYEMRDKMLQINADYYEFGDYTTRLKKLF